MVPTPAALGEAPSLRDPCIRAAAVLYCICNLRACLCRKTGRWAGRRVGMLMGEFKQEILRINNKVNMEVFGQGLLSQQAYVLQDKVLIVAKNRRVAVLRQMEGDESVREAVETMDRALIVRFKQRFIQMVREELGIEVLSHMKDYDPKLEISTSVSVFGRPVEEMLPGLSAREDRKAEREDKIDN